MIIEVKDLVKEYNKIKVVDNISFQVKSGEILGLLGPNGAGKSTTINLILGLTAMNSGNIKLFDSDINNKLSSIKKDIGYVPQDIAVFEELTAYDNITFFARLYGIRGEALKNSVKKALEFTGLWERRKDYPKSYSGGMKRRLNIACAIVNNPKLIIMDEPTVGVDPQSRNNILQSIKKLNERGTTIVYTSHYMEEIEELCERIIIMDTGKIIAEGTSDEIKKSVLKEQVIAIEVDKKIEDYKEDIINLEGVISCECNNSTAVIKAVEGINIISQILDIIYKNKLKVFSVNVEKPTLEAAFLAITGKKLRD